MEEAAGGSRAGTGAGPSRHHHRLVPAGVVPRKGRRFGRCCCRPRRTGGGYLRLLGPDHPDTLSARGHLAYWQGMAGDAGGAAAAFAQLLEDCLRVLGPDHPGTRATREGAAYWQTRTG
ncbi:tetratricopeptide repeat protein [Streptomyces triticiradicis]|uniref:tetratricopeptide repeat protein n=1 Tax=Streptomyces triticiradicis TaxID=2651189 RepID=UPI00384A4804